MEHYTGRPPYSGQESEAERETYDFLDGLGISYMTVRHDAAFTMEECAEVEKAIGAPVCKNLFLCNRQQTRFYLLMLPGDKIFKTKFLSSELGCARLSFADENHMTEMLGLHPGGSRKRLLQIFAFRQRQLVFQPGDHQGPGPGVLLLQLFRIDLPERGEQIFHKGGAFLPPLPGIDGKGGRIRLLEVRGRIGQRIVQAQTVPGQGGDKKVFRRLPEAPGVTVQKKIKKYDSKTKKKDGSKQTGEFLFQSNNPDGLFISL